NQSPGSAATLAAVAPCHVWLGMTLESLDRRQEAAEQYLEALRVCEAALAHSPRDAEEREWLGGSLFFVCWPLLRTPGPHPYDLDRVAKLAEEAVGLAPGHGLAIETAGIACYRVGRWEKALAYLEKAMTLTPDSRVHHQFFLAMVRWQLGSKD